MFFYISILMSNMAKIYSFFLCTDFQKKKKCSYRSTVHYSQVYYACIKTNTALNVMQCLNLSELPLMHLKCTVKPHLDKAACSGVHVLGKSMWVSSRGNRNRRKSSKALTFDTVMGWVEWMKGLGGEEEKEQVGRMLENQTYSDPLIFVIDFYVIPFPGDGWLRVTAWGNTLHYGWFSCSYDHIARGLPEIIPQNWKTQRGRAS